MIEARSRQEERARRLAETGGEGRVRLEVATAQPVSIEALLARAAAAGAATGRIGASVDGDLLRLDAPYGTLDARSLLQILRPVETWRLDPLPYDDYAAWQAATPVAAPSEATGEWAEPVERLPFEAEAVEPARRCGRELPNALVEAVAAEARAHVVSPEAILLAAWRLVLDAAADWEEVRLTIVHPGRPIKEMAEAVGAYAWSGAAARRPAAGTVAGLWAAMDSGLRSARETDTPPPDYADRRASPFSFCFLDVTEAAPIVWASAAPEHSPVGLTVLWSPACTRLCLSLDGAAWPEPYPDLLVERMIATLEAMVERPEIQGAAALRLGADEAAAAVGRAVPAPVAPFVPLARSVLDRAKERPDALALASPDEALGYRDLADRIERAAAGLLDRGIRPGDIVGHMLRSPIDAVAAMLAIQHAGAVCALIEDGLPGPQASRLLALARARALVHDGDGIDGMELFRWSELVSEHEGPIGKVRDATEADLAYILFTSGTTGRPKAVAVPHGALAAYGRAIDARLPLAGCARFLMVTPLAVDLGYTMLVPALTSGGTLLVVPRSTARDAAALTRFCRSAQAEALKISPTHLKALLRMDGQDILPRRLLVLGGEPFEEDVLRLVRAMTGATIANHYGPSEAAVGVAATEVAESSAGIPLGRPLDGVSAYVLDERMNPVGHGMRGELYLAGAQLACGYAGDGAGTAAGFVPDPISPLPGTRMYRTGDLVRRAPDGVLTFCGRTGATLLKRYGRRVDPEEIAAELRELDGISDAAVLPGETGEGVTLDAFVVLERSALNIAEEERIHLANWQTVFDASHAGHEAVAAAAFDSYGWNSSYDGLPLPIDEIREQVDATVGRLKQFGARKVLEVGCGTGALLRALAPFCSDYVATDPSATMIEAARIRWRRIGGGRQVRFLRRRADDLASLAPARFDLIVLNSVVQYFPSLDYLGRVLRGLEPLLARTGRIFVGDVRDLNLLETFHASLAHWRAQPDAAPEELLREARAIAERETELVVAQAAFEAFAAELGLTAEALLKRGRALNELTRFRFDTILHRAPPMPCSAVSSWRDIGGPAGMERLLRELDVACFAIREIPNARLLGTMRSTAPWDGKPPLPAGEPGMDPEDLHDLAERHHRALKLFPAVRAGFMDAAVGDSLDMPVERRWVEESKTALATSPLAATALERRRVRIREELAARLARHQLPDTLTILPDLPRSPSGKLAPGALQPAKGSARARIQRPTRNPEEAAVLQVLREVLGSESFGPDDDFFAAGGHSLLAMRALVRLQERIGAAPPLRAFFEGCTTAAQLAEVLESRDEGEPGDRQTEGSAELPVTAAERRILSEAEPDHPAYTIGFAARLDGPLDVDALRAALDATASTHEAWRSGYRSVDGVWHRFSEPRLSVPLALVDLSGWGDAAEAEASRIAAELKQQRFDLARPPLVRATLLTLGPGRHALAVMIHHLISDGWSTAILARDLSRFYAAARSESFVAPVADSGYRSVALAESRLECEGDVAARAAELAGKTPDLPWPTASSLPAVQDRSGTSIPVEVDARTVRRAVQLAREEGASLFMVLAAAYGAALADSCEVDALTLGTPIANRRSQAQETMLGCFINLLVLPLAVPDRVTFRELVRGAKAAVLRAFELGDAGFDALVNALGARTDGPRPPLFQAMLELANMPEGRFDLEGLTVSELPFEHGTSEFELNLILRESGNGLAGWLIYRRALFDRAQAKGIFHAFEHALQAGVEAPDMLRRPFRPG